MTSTVFEPANLVLIQVRSETLKADIHHILLSLVILVPRSEWWVLNPLPQDLLARDESTARTWIHQITF